MFTVFISVFFFISWVYIRLKIDSKKTNILLWFLDIPVHYASYLSDNCDGYLKNFTSIKEVMSKGVKVE